jgi:cytochrome c-type biogenesis protein CcmH/NrfG
MAEGWWLSGMVLVTLAAGFVAIRPLRLPLKYGGAWVILLLLCVSVLYRHWGGFAAWHHHAQLERKQQQARALIKSMGSTDAVIKRLRVRLQDTPDSAQGWYLLGRLYAGQGDWQKARDSYEKAHHLNANKEVFKVHLAYSLWQLNHQTCTESIRALYHQILRQNPSQPDAMSMLAMDAYQQHDYLRAIQFWQRLLELMNPDSQEADAIRQAIAKAERKRH